MGPDLPESRRKHAAVTADALRYIWATTVAPLVTDAVIQEHASDPLGVHSDALDKVLVFLRYDPVPSVPRLVVVIVRDGAEWAVGEHARLPGTPIRVRSSPRYDSLETIEHAIFLERLAAVRRAFGDGAEALGAAEQKRQRRR